MTFKFNDGGRKEAGFKGVTGDCVCRAISIATGRPYREVYDRLAQGMASQRVSKSTPKKSPRSAANGVTVNRQWFKDYMKELGFVWVPTMRIGQGCKIHLDTGELPDGVIIVRLSKHYTCVIDQVINDTYDPRRRTEYEDEDGNKLVSRRCVYGYWKLDT